jgi:hypothetical protein
MKRQVSRFIVKALLFTIPIVVFFEALYRLGFAPIITNSTLFDSKMLQVQKQHIKKVGLMTMGSSVALYEVKSSIITQNLHMPYYNFSSWGLQMADTRVLLNSFVNKYHPKYVLLCSSIADFIAPQNETYLNYANAPEFIKDDLPELFYFRNYNSIHQVVRRKHEEYPQKFDNWGGASLSIEAKHIKRNIRYEHDIFPTKYTQANYEALDAIGISLKAQHVRFIFIEAPINKSYANTARSIQLLQAHFDKCRAIVERQGGTYLNYYNTSVFTDSLFTDQYHMQDAGSMILTKEIVKDVKKITGL